MHRRLSLDGKVIPASGIAGVTSGRLEFQKRITVIKQTLFAHCRQ